MSQPSPSSSPSSSRISTLSENPISSTATPTTKPIAAAPPVAEQNFKPNSQVDKSTTKITDNVFIEGVEIPLTVSSSRTGGKQTSSTYGSISIPPKLIPVGWSVLITPVNETETKKPKPSSSNDSCGSSSTDDGEEDTGQFSSLAFNMEIEDERGHQRSLQELLSRSDNSEAGGIEITLSYSMTRSQREQFDPSEMKFVYLETGDTEWKLSNEDVRLSGDGGFGNISTTVNHLTSKWY